MYVCVGMWHSFSRPQDKARHSRSSVRSRCAAGSVNVSVSCQCQQKFRRPQDIARHKCSIDQGEYDDSLT